MFAENLWDFNQSLYCFLFALPLFSSWVNGTDIILSYRKKINPDIDRIKRLLIFFYFCSGIIWFFLILLQFDQGVHNYISSLFYTFSILWILLFYQYIFYMTSLEQGEKFNMLHYIFPLVFFFLYLIVYPFFSILKIHFLNVNNGFIVNSTYEDSSFIFYSLTLSGRLFMLIYGYLCVRRLKRFTIAAKRESKFNKWLWIVFSIYCGLFVSIFFRLFSFRNTWILLILTAITSILFVTLQSIISFHILSRHFKLANAENLNPAESGKRKYTTFQETRYKSFQQKKQRVKTVIDRSEFENYFCLKKPYLNPKLKLEDLVDVFKACRSIISSFVNKTYNLSFSWYVNKWRLEEMEKLLKHESNVGKDPKKLALRAGFGSYRNYLRAKSYFSNTKTSEQ